MTTSVETRSLVKTYGADIHAVRGVDIRIEPGELMVLVGPSGCGKTTTLRMVAGLESVTEGEIFVGDRLVNRVHPSKRGVALVFQNFALYPHKTARDNMAFPLESSGVSKSEVRRRVDDVAEMLELSEHLDKKPSELSGGQQQRVSLGRAVVRDPEVLLLDEPLSNLDARLRVVMRSELKTIQRRVGSTAIYVTHDQVEAMTMGDRIVVMNEGEVAQIGTPADVYLTPANVPVARTIGSPSMNLLSGEIGASDGELALRGDGWSVTLDGVSADYLRERLSANGCDRITLGVRPDDLDLNPRIGVVNSENDTAMAEARCLTAEPLGSEALYNMELATRMVGVLRQDTHTIVDEGDVADIVVAPGGRIHVFDGEGGQRVASLQRLVSAAGARWEPYETSGRR